MKRKGAREDPERLLSRILSKFDSGDRHELARQLVQAFRLRLSESYPRQIQAGLGRELSRDESFRVGVLHRIAVLQDFDYRPRASTKRTLKKAVKKVAKKAVM